ncbi:MAG: FkbM family methyltransferase [Actinomycetota bacterium]|nr:FkbM family methyltransferase [Actinomycetota bacterium]
MTAPAWLVAGAPRGPARGSGDELEELLSEPVGHAREREQTTFERASGPGPDRIVLFGAGRLGRRTLAGLRAAGVDPVAFSDNRPGSWGTELDGVPVLAPEQAAARHGADAVFVVTIWGAGSTHRLEDTRAQLASLGCERVVPAAWLAWRHAEQLLPFYAMDLPSRLLEQSDDVRRGFAILADDPSRAEYVSQVRWRLDGDPGGLAHPVPGTQYLVTDVATVLEGEVVLDCGAYDGDTLRSWLAERGPGFRAYVAMEPDPATRARLERCVAALEDGARSRVRVLPYSVGGTTGTVTFSASGSLSSSLRDDGPGVGGIEVECVRLDDLAELEETPPTFVKMDIEGAELDALAGASSLVTGTHPMLAVAAYHRQDHLWRVPLALRALWSRYSLSLRPHNEQGWDLICYAVPPGRVPDGRVRQ